MSTAAQAERSGDLVSDRIVDNLDTRSVHWSSSSHKSSTTPLSLLSLKNTPAVAPVAIHFSSSFPATIAPNSNAYVYAVSPPSLFELSNTLDVHNIPNKLYKGPYYSINSDAPDNPREYAGLLYHLQGGDGLGSLEEWGGDKPRDTNDPITSVFMRKVEVSVLGGWEFAGSPPNPKEVKRWLTSDIGLATLKKTIKSRSQVYDILPNSAGEFNWYSLDRRSNAKESLRLEELSGYPFSRYHSRETEHDHFRARGFRSVRPTPRLPNIMTSCVYST